MRHMQELLPEYCQKEKATETSKLCGKEKYLNLVCLHVGRVARHTIATISHIATISPRYRRGIAKRQYMAIFGYTRRYPAIRGDIRQYAAIRGDTRRYSAHECELEKKKNHDYVFRYVLPALSRILQMFRVRTIMARLHGRTHYASQHDRSLFYLYHACVMC